MSEPSSLTTFSITPSSKRNGASTTYVISFEAVSPLEDTDYLEITFPSEIGVSASLSCVSGSNLSKVVCTTTDQETVKALFSTFSNSIETGDKVSFDISTITNAPSTAPSSAFSDIVIYSKDGYKVSKYTTGMNHN